MSMIRRSKREMPGLNTASLPDLIFTVLFFFMIVTHMRTDVMKVRYQTPQGTELSKVKKKSATIHVYIGSKTTADGKAVGQPVCVQVADKVVALDEVVDYLIKAKVEIAPEDKQKLMIAIYADKKAPMGVVTSVKQAARQAKIYNVCYSASEK